MERTGWVKDSFYAEEAARRGLTVDACRQLVAQIPSPPPTSNSPLSINGGTRDQRAFLEAAVFFITGVDTTKVDMVTNREIVLGRYPIVAYLVDSNPCAVRIRTTTKPYTVWQMDFCKITHYQRVNYVPIYQLVWVGQKSAFCVYRGWSLNENYIGPIDEQTSECVRADGASAAIWSSTDDIRNLITIHNSGGFRDVGRMVASFKYIVTLLTGKPY